MEKTKVKEFLDELTDVSRKYKIVLLSCSCCSGINLEESDELGHYDAEIHGDDGALRVYDVEWETKK